MTDCSKVISIIAETIRNLKTIGFFDNDCIVKFRLEGLEGGVFTYSITVRQKSDFTIGKKAWITSVLEDALRNESIDVCVSYLPELNEGYEPTLYGMNIKFTDMKK